MKNKTKGTTTQAPKTELKIATPGRTTQNHRRNREPLVIILNVVVSQRSKLIDQGIRY